jgi:hypothetical protein
MSSARVTRSAGGGEGFGYREIMLVATLGRHWMVIMVADALEHVWQHLLANSVEEFGHGGDMQV